MRRLTGLLVLVGALLVVAGWVSWDRTETRQVGTGRFDHALRIPSLAPSHVDSSGRRVFDLTMQTGCTDLGAARCTPTWGIDGAYLGPTLRARRGERVLVHVRDALPEPTTLHWHGMHLPPRMDGGPHQMIEPGTTWSPTWRVDQPAATLWYHPHLDGRTAVQVYRGLAGVFVVDDDNPAARQLPHTYGVDDVPVVVQDKRLTGDGRLDESGRGLSNTGLLGDRIVVDGTPDPHLDVTTERVRLRIVNASNARVYDFGFDDDRTYDLVATDGGLLAGPVPTRRVQLAPGERAEVVVAVRPGERPVLRSYPPQLGAGFLSDRLAGGGDSFDVLQLRAAGALRPSPGVPAHLADLPAADEAHATTTRSFELDDDTINGRHMDMSRIDFTVRLGDTEIWRVHNRSGVPHSFHVHDQQLRVLSVDGAPPPPELGGYKDTVYVAPDRTIELLVRFTDYADPRWPYMVHCHMLRHEDHGMMGQFLVLGPGQAAPRRLGDDGGSRMGGMPMGT